MSDLWEKQSSLNAAAAVETWDVWERAALLVSAVQILPTCNTAAPELPRTSVTQTETSPKWQHFLSYSFNYKNAAPSINKIQLQVC